MSHDVVLIVTALITTTAGLVGGWLATKSKNQKISIPQSKNISIIEPVFSRRMQAMSVDISVPSKVYKTRKYDKIMAPHSGVITVDEKQVTIENDIFISILSGLSSLRSTNNIVNQGDLIGIVTKFESDEGRLSWNVKDKTVVIDNTRQ